MLIFIEGRVEGWGKTIVEWYGCNLEDHRRKLDLKVDEPSLLGELCVEQ